MLIKSAEYFTYASTPSTDFGIININIESSSLLEEPFVAEREIEEIKIRGRTQPYFKKVKLKSLQFSVSFAFEDTWDDIKLRNVVNWLCNYNYYQPLYFDNNTDRIFYALVVESPLLIHNCLSQGYIKLTFRCNSPFLYSSLKQSENYDFTSNGIIIDNLSIGILNNIEII